MPLAWLASFHWICYKANMQSLPNRPSSNVIAPFLLDSYLFFVSEFCLSCGKTSVATFHPLFEGGLCLTCKVTQGSLAFLPHSHVIHHNTTWDSGNPALQHAQTRLLIKQHLIQHLDTAIVSIGYIGGQIYVWISPDLLILCYSFFKWYIQLFKLALSRIWIDA